MRIAAIIALVVLAGCNPMDTADQILRQSARAVIVPVLGRNLPAPMAESAADCIIAAATPQELRAIAADIGNTAGTSTIANISALAARPQTVRCLIAGAIPMVAL